MTSPPAVSSSPAASSSPAVSVVVPTYNHRDYVLDALSSVFDQTFTDTEVIVVDDGSEDDTDAVLAPLRDAGRIRYFRQANAGQAAARNRGLAEARGRYVAFLDDDDLWPPDRLAWQVELLESDAACVMVYGDFLKLRDGRAEPHAGKHGPSGAVTREFRTRNWLVSPGQALMRTTAVRSIGGFDRAIWGSDDWDLYIRLSRKGEFQYRPRVALHYRIHEAMASRSAVRHAANHLLVVRRHIGWDLPMLVRHQWLAGGYFVPRLRAYAESRRESGEHREALRADVYALAFRPTLLVRPRFLAGLSASAVRALATRRPTPA